MIHRPLAARTAVFRRPGAIASTPAEETSHLTRLRSLIRSEQKTRWKAFGFSQEWSFDLRPVEAEGENATKYLAAFFSKSGAPQKKVFVKQYHHPEIGRRTVENEFQGLLIAHRAFKDAGAFRAPQPYSRLLDEKIIFMEHCPSFNLKKRLFDSLRFSRFVFSKEEKEAISRKIMEAAALLASFQNIPAASHPTDKNETAEGALFRYQRQFIGHLEHCRQVGFPEALLRRIESYVLKNLRTASRASFYLNPSLSEVVLQHSDFAPWNLLVGEKHLYLTDFQNFTVGLSCYDLAFFYTALGLLGRYRTLNRSFLSRLQSLFLETFMERRGRPLSLFKTFQIMHMLYFVGAGLHTYKGLFYESLYAVPFRSFMTDWFNRNLE